MEFREIFGTHKRNADRLLILACSQRKKIYQDRMRAIDRYDGPTFGVLRKYLRERGDDSLTVWILSAKFGLIAADREIPWYDLRLTRALADSLRPSVLEIAANVLPSTSWRSIGLCLGKEYLRALDGFADLVPEGVRIDRIAGGQGRRLAALRDWLRQSGWEGRVSSHGDDRERDSDQASRSAAARQAEGDSSCGSSRA